MLLPIIVVEDLISICYVVDIITTLYYLLLAFNSKVAGVIAILCGDDGKPHFVYLYCWQMLLPWW